MTSVRGQSRPTQKSQASEAPTNLFNDGNHKDPLKSNKSGPSEALEASIGPLEAPLPTFQTPDIAQYM